MASLRYYIVDAFTSTAFRGNPAAVVILPSSNTPSDDGLFAIAREFNLPMTAFLYSAGTTNKPATPSFRLRWFTAHSTEYQFCGHATLATSHILFSSPDIIGDDAKVIQFSTLAGMLKARKVGGEIELDFPAGEIALVDDLWEDSESLRSAVANAISLAGLEHIKAIGLGQGDSFKHLAMVELDPSIELDGIQVDVSQFSPFGPRTIVLTTTTETEAYILRVFTHYGGYHEDAVTGSANAGIASYWARKLGYEEHSGKVMRVKQLSPRGGELGVIWDGDRVKLRSVARTIAKGTLYL